MSDNPTPCYVNEHSRNTKLAACQVCWYLFQPKRAGHIYCSDACRQKAYRKRHGLRAWKCLKCGALHIQDNPLEVVCGCGHNPQVMELIYVMRGES